MGARADLRRPRADSGAATRVRQFRFTACEPQISDGPGNATGASGEGSRRERDQLARPEAPAELRAALLENVLANAPVGVWALDRDGAFVLAEGKELELMGLDPSEATGRSIGEVFGDVPEIGACVRSGLAGESGAATVELDGGVFTVWYGPLRNRENQPIGMVGVATDVTTQQRANAELLAERRLTEKMLRSHERDRRLIAYEIHDGPVQNMAAAHMRLQALLYSGRIPEGPTRDELTDTMELVRKAVEETRHVINGLRPPILDDLGVVPAVEYLIADQSQGGPSITLSVEGEIYRLEPLLEGTIYRVVQEAIANVRRHSKSQRAEVRIARKGDWIELEIRDWGVGFDPANVEEKRLGLQGIRERARLLHGRAAIESAPGEGTRVTVDLPIPSAPQ